MNKPSPSFVSVKQESNVNYFNVKYNQLWDEYINYTIKSIFNVIATVESIDNSNIKIQIPCKFLDEIKTLELNYKVSINNNYNFKLKSFINLDIVKSRNENNFTIYNINNIEQVSKKRKTWSDIVSEPIKVPELTEDDYIDPITGNFIENPVRFITINDKITPHVVDISTAKNCIKKNNICPFTKLEIKSLIRDKDLEYKIKIWKKYNQDTYKKIILEQKNNMIKENEMIKNRVKNKINKFVNLMNEDKTIQSLNYTCSENKEVDFLIQILNKEPIKLKSYDLENDLYLYYNIKKYKAYFNITLFKQCRCDYCLQTNFFRTFLVR